MPVLAHFGNQDARAAAFGLGKGIDQPTHFFKGGVIGTHFGFINSGDGTDNCLMAAINLFQRIGNFANRAFGPGCLHGKLQQIARFGIGSVGQGVQGCFNCLIIAFGAQTFQLGDLLAADFGVIDLQHIHRAVIGDAVFVHTDQCLAAAINAGLGAGGGFLDPHFRNTGFNGFGHAALFFHLGNMGPGFFGQIAGQALHIITAAPWVDHVGGAAFLLQKQLGVTRNAGRKIGWQGQGFVQCIGMKRLGMTLCRCHGFDTGADHVVKHILCCQRPARCLAVGAQRQRLGALRVKLFDQLGPDHARRAHFGNFHKEIHANRPEKRQARGEFINIEPGFHACTGIFHPVGQGIGQFKVGGGPGFLHVIAGNGNRIEFRHVLRGKGKNVGNDPHRGFGRIDIGVAHHKFFKNVVLDGAGKLGVFNPLFLGGSNIQRHHRQHRAVHGHGNRHLIQRNAIKQRAHVIDAVNRHTGHPDIARHPGVVAVITAMGGQVEGYRQALLPGGKVAAVKGVGFLGGGKTGILAHGPGALHIHGGVGAAQKGRYPRHGVQMIQTVQVIDAVNRFYINAFGGGPWHARYRARGRVCGGVKQGQVGKIRNPGHGYFTPRWSRTAVVRATTSDPTKMNSLIPAASNAARLSPGCPAR